MKDIRENKTLRTYLTCQKGSKGGKGGGGGMYYRGSENSPTMPSIAFNKPEKVTCK